MKLAPIIAALRARCPEFQNRVAGAAQFKDLPEVGKMKLPAAYVVNRPGFFGECLVRKLRLPDHYLYW